jgi:DNA-binding transcriptional LysR family regulator
MIELRELRYFLAVADELHFARAADRLGIAPSTLSHGIHQLERELGTALFVRTSRSVALTPAGADLAGSLPSVLRRLEHALAAARSAGQDAGSTRSGAAPPKRTGTLA